MIKLPLFCPSYSATFLLPSPLNQCSFKQHWSQTESLVLLQTSLAAGGDDGGREKEGELKRGKKSFEAKKEETKLRCF